MQMAIGEKMVPHSYFLNHPQTKAQDCGLCTTFRKQLDADWILAIGHQ